MKNPLLIPLTLLAAIILTACASRPLAGMDDTKTDGRWIITKDQVWQLVKIQGRNIPNDAKTVTLTFNPEAGSYRGRATCNSYGGDYTIGEASTPDGRHPFSINDGYSGSVGCPEADMNAEGRYISAFHKANYILITEHTLILYQNDKEILRFELQ